LSFSPQKQKQLTLEALVAWLLEEAERAVVYCAWEDLHWADPSTLEILTLFLGQVPTTRVLTLLTFRPEFTPPWGNRSHLSQLTLSRLSRTQVREMVSHVAAQAARASTGSARTGNISPSDSASVRPELVEGGIALPDDLIDAVIARTDGVPLFVEELTKTVLESVESRESVGSGRRLGQSSLLSGIPATLQDALMARLDRLGPVKEVAQLGATLGREFSYELMQAVCPLDEVTLQHGLKQLVEAELLYQRGLLPQARYLFKHALIQDTAYQSLLKSSRQQYHKKIVQAFEDRFPETQDTQPELVAHHYTEAGLITQAIPYWQKAGQKAAQRSANVEAVTHLTTGLELLKTLPDTPERAQQELDLQIVLGPALMATKGYAAPDVAQAYTRARELCQQVGETPQLLQVLLGLAAYYMIRAELQTARELGEQCLPLAQRMHDLARLLQTHYTLGVVLFQLGELVLAREHFEQSMALYNPQKRRSHRALQDPGVGCLSYTALILWSLGYPEQALKKSHEALTLAQELSHSFSLAVALNWTAWLHQCRREGQLTQERAEAAMTQATEQGFPYWLAWGRIMRGGALAEQGRGEEGITQMRQGITAYLATGGETGRPHFLALLAEAYGKQGQAEEGLRVLTEALTPANKNEDRYYEAELYRLKGELTLRQENQKANGKSRN
ncbi:MAG: tetratricopeptide repeat protein, partial [Deltaproteobacteria bacterium]|nr:tetratricopeptide repeat protein [Deltaproteobacteria bacterium]